MSSEATTFFKWLRDYDFSNYHFDRSIASQFFKRFFYLSRYDFILAVKLALRTIYSTALAFANRLLRLAGRRRSRLVRS